MFNQPIRFRNASFVLLLLAQTVLSSACSGKEGVETYMVAMSDGTKLATDIYRPAKGNEPYPVILMRTPYYRWYSARLTAE